MSRGSLDRRAVARDGRKENERSSLRSWLLEKDEPTEGDGLQRDLQRYRPRANWSVGGKERSPSPKVRGGGAVKRRKKKGGSREKMRCRPVVAMSIELS